jgi:hypothetical protein
VGDPVAAHDRGRVLQPQRLGQTAGRKERAAGPEDHRNLVDHHPVDQPEPERLAADLTSAHVDVPVAGELLGRGNRLLDAVDERERCGLGVLPVRRRLMGDDENVLAGGRLATQPLVRSNSRRPITFAAMSRYWLRMKSAEAWVLRDSPSEPGKLQVTSPLPYQSNSGPTRSLSSVMNPSRETAAPMIVLPMIPALRL